eukprot:g3383.t1
MRKVQSAPQLTLLSPSAVNSVSRTLFDSSERLAQSSFTRLPSHGPCLPQRMFGSRRPTLATGSLPLALMVSEVLGEFDTLAQKMETEVVFEAETNSVTVAANSCFAEFGVSPQDAPELFFGSKKNLNDREESLAVCLATPFEGKPEMLSRVKPRMLVAFSRDQSQLLVSEVERKHLRRLLSYEQRKKRQSGEFTFSNMMCWTYTIISRTIATMFWRNVFLSLQKRA